ncbi:hypothetical protein CRUP_025682, partial [Coryphaenoides rupestris]
MEDSYHKADQQTVQALRNLAHRLRIHSIRATTAAGSGHPTSCCSVAEIMSVLFFNSMKYHLKPQEASTTTASSSPRVTPPPSCTRCGRDGLPEGERAPHLRKVGLHPGGHPVRVSGSDSELPDWNGLHCYRVYCLLGDGEMSEGSVWEAMSFASYYQLDNLVAVVDVNRLGQSDPTPLQHHVEKWQAVIVDGHSVEELCK